MKIKHLIFITIIIKIFFAFLPSFDIDMNAWLAWSYRLTNLGPANFYSTSVWTQYTPGFLYYLLLIGKISVVNPIIIKLPSILAETTTALLISPSPLILFSYTLSPAVIFNSSVWGQIDGLLSMFLFISIYLIVEKKKPVLAWLSWAIAFVIKPQSLLLLPVLTIITIKKFNLSKTIKSFIYTETVIFFLSLPFFPKDPFLGLPKLIISMGQYYSYTSVFAYNFWQIATGPWKTDQAYFRTGIILYLVSTSLILARLYINKFKKHEIYLASALSALAFFLFPTRVHERYIFPFFPFILATFNSSKNKRYFYIYLLSSAAFLINLYYPYSYYTKNFLSIQSLKGLTLSLAPLVSLLYLSTFAYLLFYKSSIKLPKIKLKNPLLWILIFALATRLFMLMYPKNEYFDEVYHAFTARQMLHNNPKAWEWWNPNPKGFAYEWTHPPLAKLGMVLGMFILGESSFGWRFPGAILGTLSVYLVYLIAKTLFPSKSRNHKIALLSALVFSLDGLPLVMSRIGMNDTYLLFFMLLSYYLYLKNKYFYSAFTLGLAAASKWSILWFLPILAVTHLSQRRKFTPQLIWFFILPPIVYFASYAPMFIFPNHNIHTFIEVQKQMWWYHTNLKATHPYTSPWWSWPFLVRPIWLYVDYTSTTTIKNIYAMGNPIVFWMGIISVPYIFYKAFTKKLKNLSLVLFSFFIFFVPWALSPRIMFLYHYLPSIPFLSILMGYFLSNNKKYIQPFVLAATITFIFFYPHWTGLEVPKWLDNLYYIFPSWK